MGNAQASPTDDALDLLREAADELMRAIGRVLIEIEQLRYRQANPD